MNNCSNLLTFDTTEIKSDFSSKIAFLQYVNAQNYEEMKQKYSLSLFDYFSGDFDSFAQKRNALTQLLIESEVTELSQSYYQHALSRDGAQAYAQCVAETNRKQIAAWVEFSTSTEIVIVVRTGVIGEDTISVSIEPSGANDQPKLEVQLIAGGSRAFKFAYNPKTDFFVIVNSTSKKTGAQEQAIVEVPRIRSMRIIEDVIDVTTSITAGAGGQGNSSANPTWDDGSLVAPVGYYLLQETFREVPPRVPVWQCVKGGGLRFFELEQTPIMVNGKLKSIHLHPKSIDGTNGDEQGKVRITYTITAMRQRVVEDP